MSECPGLHCPGCRDHPVRAAGSLAAAAAVLAVVAEFATEILAIIGTAVVLVLAAVVFFAVRAWRRGWRPSFRTVIAWEPYTAPELPPASPRPAQALPAPRELHIHLHGVTPAQAAAEIAAIRNARYRAFDQYEGR